MKAFPISGMSQFGDQPIEAVYNTGMDLRDYFAAAALQGILAHPETGVNPDPIIIAAYKFADEMLKQREKK
jgi:hypothetical protein